MTDMLKLLKIVDKVEKPVMINEAVSLNISANGDCACDITNMLSKLVNLSSQGSGADSSMHNHDSMVKSMTDVGRYTDGTDDAGMDEWANEPEPEVSDVEYMTKDLAGGLNKPKKQFKKEYPGDNPMTMEGSLANKLMVEYKNLIENDDKNKEGKVVHCSQCSKGFKLNPDTPKTYHTGFSHCKDHKGLKMVASEGIGASTIKHKQKLSHMTDKEFADHPHYAKMSDDDLRSMAWRHGHGGPGKPGHDHYVNRRNKGKTTDEDWEAGTAPKGSNERKRKAVQMALGRRHKDDPEFLDRMNPKTASLIHGRKLQKQGINKEDQVNESSAMKLDAYRKKAELKGGRDPIQRSVYRDAADEKIKKKTGSYNPGIFAKLKDKMKESTEKKPTDDAKKKKAEKIKAYRADRDKHGED